MVALCLYDQGMKLRGLSVMVARSKVLDGGQNKAF